LGNPKEWQPTHPRRVRTACNNFPRNRGRTRRPPLPSRRSPASRPRRLPKSPAMCRTLTCPRLPRPGPRPAPGRSRQSASRAAARKRRSPHNREAPPRNNASARHRRARDRADC